MLNTKRYPVRMNGAEPFVEQCEVNGYTISWNPDDSLFYVTKGGETVKVYNAMRNAVQYCKNN